MKNSQLRAAWVIAVMICVGASAYASDYSKYPEPLRSRRDVARASERTDNIWIGSLALEDYPLLAKFTGLKRVRFETKNGTGANDEKLGRLAAIGFTNLFDFGLLNCPEVTDKGISYLVQLPAIRYLQLEGTSITDAGCKTLAAKRSVTGVNVAHCTNVTLRGLIDLAHSDTLDNLSFSFAGLTQEDVLRVIGEFRHARWCQIVDPIGEVDAETVQKAGAAKGAQIVLHPQGALRTFLGEQPRPWSPKSKQPK